MAEKVTQKVVLSILRFLRAELDSGALTEDSNESLEVAVQCLESAYNLERTQAQARNVPDLVELFSTTSDFWTDEPPVEQVSEENKAKAEKMKNLGNNAMKDEKFTEAIDNYTTAISLNPTNAVYYCNRAAAYTRLNNHQEAINDCKTAIKLDPTYSKAYGRLGFSYSSLNQHENARQSYLKAIQLEPDNESYKNNLKLANESLARDGQGTAAATPGLPAGLPPGLDFNALMNNPAVMNMASQMLSNPNMQNLMSGLMNMGTGDSNFDALIQAGQQLAAQMQNTTDFVENLRRQMSGNEQSDQPQSDQDQPPSAEPADKKDQ